DPLAVAVDPLPLLVHHLVVFEQVLADFEVVLLALLLGPFDAAAHHLALDGLSLLHAEPSEHIRDPLAGEDPHEIVFERQVEPARTGVTLATATAAELKVDTAGFVALGADNMKAPKGADFVPLLRHPFFLV